MWCIYVVCLREALRRILGRSITDRPSHFIEQVSHPTIPFYDYLAALRVDQNDHAPNGNGGTSEYWAWYYYRFSVESHPGVWAFRWTKFSAASGNSLASQRWAPVAKWLPYCVLVQLGKSILIYEQFLVPT